MSNKEPIIIDTNKYFVEIIDEGRSTIGYTVVSPGKLLTEIIKQNKQLARKTQECEDLKLILQQSKDNNKSTMLLLTKKNEECEQLKKLADANPNSTLRLRNEIRDLQAVSVKCKEALDEIKKICLQERNIQDICLISTQLTKTRIKYDIQDEILTIIDKAKGWK